MRLRVNCIGALGFRAYLSVAAVMLFAPLASADAPSGLQLVLQMVIANNPAIQGKQAEVDAQGYAVSGAKAGRYPSFSGQVNSFNNSDGQTILRLDQPLWAFGKIDAEIALSKAKFNIEQLGLLKVERELLERAAVAYARIEGVAKQQQVAITNVAAHTDLFQQIQRRQQGMLASETDVGLAFSRLLQARSSLQQLEGDHRLAVADLEVLVQRRVDVSERVDTALIVLPDEKYIAKQALFYSVDLQEKKAGLAVARLALAKEKVATLPTLSLRAEKTVADSNQFNNDSRVGLVFEASLDGFGFASSGRIKSATALLKAAQRDVDVTLNEVVYQIDRLLINKRSLAVSIAIQRDAVEAVKGTAASFYRQYDSGRKSWLDVLNTQRELENLQTQLERTRNEALVVSLRIAAALGQLDVLAGITNS